MYTLGSLSNSITASPSEYRDGVMMMFSFGAGSRMKGELLASNSIAICGVSNDGVLADKIEMFTTDFNALIA
jgi:hypothetical protein